jgi:hypothetical protein
MTLTADRLREVLDYNPATGIFTCRVSRGGRAGGRIGSVVGRMRKRDGYIVMMVDRKTYAAHRLAFLWMTGGWPQDHVDHINRNTSDNRWSNLRAATIAENMANSVRRRGTKRDVTLPRGVYKLPSGRFQAKYGKDGYIGLFDTPEDARAAVLAVVRERGLERFIPEGAI